ncbi:MAG: hypothetical protein NZ898_05405 [Myxococcota bacterium]|nr:hypothetical protein [Myxococcota bacterium]MDW8362082.1 hypothetical protein [Myxococcales bacterium]
MNRSNPRWRRALCLVVFGLLVGTAAGAIGQSRAERGSGRRTERAAPAPERTTEVEDAAAGARSAEIEEGEQKVKVFQFSGLDIGGRLKTPQLLYFLNRLRTEFDRPRLPHRSFRPELERATRSEAFR